MIQTGTVESRTADLAREFVAFSLESGVLRFGEFKTKAGRLSPYFFNAGLFNDGAKLGRLAEFYARRLMRARQDGELQFDMLFGPAYKGIVLAAAVGGAGRSASAQTDAAAVRAKLLLPQEPVDPLTPTAAKETLLSKDAPKGPQAIVIAGRIGAKGMEPFLENKASFVLQEIPADDHAGKAGHDADNCPFCKKRSANAPMVAVQFVGADGKVLPLDARGAASLLDPCGVGEELGDGPLEARWRGGGCGGHDYGKDREVPSMPITIGPKGLSPTGFPLHCVAQIQARNHRSNVDLRNQEGRRDQRQPHPRH